MPKLTHIEDPSANLTTIRDPMILVAGDTYYVTGTQPPYWKGPNDGVHLWSSKNLVHFTDHGLILKRSDMPKDMWCRDRFWAPELFDGKDGWFYLTFNCRNESEEYFHEHSVGLARARSVTGPYEIMTVSKPLRLGNDGTLFRDDDGTCYVGSALKGQRLHLNPVDLTTGEIGQEQVVCAKGAEGEWDTIGVEGQCIVKRHGIYFQWYSSWTHGYAAGLLTADNICGPWKKAESINPVLSENEVWHRAGHNHCFIGLDGKDYITFHAEYKDETMGKGEKFFIQPVEYHPDGTVTLG